MTRTRGVIIAAVAVTAAVAGWRLTTERRSSGERHPMTDSPEAAEIAEGSGERSSVARSAVTVAAPVEQVHARWRDLDRLPTFMAHLESVEVLDERRSRWTARPPLPGLPRQQWEAVIDEDEAPRRIGWHATSQRYGGHRGLVTFVPAPGGRGTEVRAEIHYQPPLGPVGRTVGDAIAKVVGESPTQQLREDLRRFKAVIECGEAVVIDGQPSGRSGPRRAVTSYLAAQARSGGRA